MVLALTLALACQLSLATYRARVRQESPNPFATSLARDRDMTRDWEGRELALDTPMARVREGSPLALATSLAMAMDMTRDLEGRELALATSREDLALKRQGREDTLYEVESFCLYQITIFPKTKNKKV